MTAHELIECQPEDAALIRRAAAFLVNAGDLTFEARERLTQAVERSFGESGGWDESAWYVGEDLELYPLEEIRHGLDNPPKSYVQYLDEASDRKNSLHGRIAEIRRRNCAERAAADEIIASLTAERDRLLEERDGVAD